MNIDVLEMNKLIAKTEQVATLFYQMKMALQSDDITGATQAYGSALSELDNLADLKSALLG